MAGVVRLEGLALFNVKCIRQCMLSDSATPLHLVKCQIKSSNLHRNMVITVEATIELDSLGHERRIVY